MTEEEKRRAKPIIFSTPMVEAILDGRKTQTRRVIRPDVVDRFVLDNNGNVIGSYTEGMPDAYPTIDDAPYQIGDILWVRETWAKIDSRFGGDLEPGEYAYVYKASENGKAWEREIEGWKWKPSIHMPKEAARIFLTVVDVRPERLQDITEEDARAEGVSDPYDYQEPSYYEQPYLRNLEIHQAAFAGLWDNLNAKRGHGWDKNDWVWVYTFDKIRIIQSG